MNPIIWLPYAPNQWFTMREFHCAFAAWIEGNSWIDENGTARCRLSAFSDLGECIAAVNVAMIGGKDSLSTVRSAAIRGIRDDLQAMESQPGVFAV